MMSSKLAYLLFCICCAINGVYCGVLAPKLGEEWKFLVLSGLAWAWISTHFYCKAFGIKEGDWG